MLYTFLFGDSSFFEGHSADSTEGHAFYLGGSGDHAIHVEEPDAGRIVQIEDLFSFFVKLGALFGIGFLHAGVDEFIHAGVGIEAVVAVVQTESIRNTEKTFALACREAF